MAELYARTFKFPKFNHAKGILAGKLPPTPSTILQGRSVSKLGSGLRRNHTWRKAKNLREEEITKVCTNGVRAVKRTGLQEDYSPEMDPQEVFIVVTSNACHFYRKHQRESRFLDQFENAGFVCLSIKTHKLGSPFASRRRPWMTWHGLPPLKA